MLIAFNNMHLMRQLNLEMEEELRMKLWTCSYEVILSFLLSTLKIPGWDLTYYFPAPGNQ